jgi:hypothetical protein
MLDAKLKNSRFGQEEFLNLMVDEFEKKAGSFPVAQSEADIHSPGPNFSYHLSLEFLRQLYYID